MATDARPRPEWRAQPSRAAKPVAASAEFPGECARSTVARPGGRSTSTRDRYLEVARRLRRGRLRDVRRTSAPSTTCAIRTGRCPRRRRAERFEVVVNLLSHRDRRRVRAAGAGARARPGRRRRCSTSTPGARTWSARRSTCSGSFRRAPRPDPDPHARGLGGSPAAQGLLGRTRPGAVQGSAGPAMTDEELGQRRPRRVARSCRPETRRARSSSPSRRARPSVLPEGLTVDPGDIDVRVRRRRDDDHQPGPAAPLHPRRAAGSCSSSTARRCCGPSPSSATSTPAWRRRARSSPTCRAPRT